MQMQQDWIYHNSHELSYRSPFGAVPCGAEITLRLNIMNNTLPESVLIFVTRDGMEKQKTTMQLEQNKNGIIVYQSKINTPDTPGLLWYYFSIYIHGKTFYYGNNIHMLGGKGEIKDAIPPPYQITVYKEGASSPVWLKDAIMYQIFVDRFYNGYEDGTILNPKPNSLIQSHWNNTPIYIRDPEEKGKVIRWDFFGGNLLGIIKKLSYLQELGINLIYLNPIFESPSNHKYDTSDYKKVDPMYGDNEVLKYLCDTAKKMGINVILDGVFSHTGSDSIYFNKYGNYAEIGAYQSTKSPYYSWYRFHQHPDSYESWWGIDSLPNVNELEPSYQDFIIHDEDSVAKFWIKLGTKGWRLDVVDEIPDEFLKSLYKTIKELDRDAILLGEVWEDASNKISYGNRRQYLLGEELDSVTNYPFRNILIDFILGKINAYDTHTKLMSLYENYPIEYFYSTMNLIGGHDVPRILTVLSEMPKEETLSFQEKSEHKMNDYQKAIGIARLKLLSLMQMTFPGVPCIYYGDEAGTVGYGDPLCRGTYPWGNENLELLNWYKKIIAIRKQNDCLRTGIWVPVYYSDDVYGFFRIINNDTDIFGQKRNNGRILSLFHRNASKEKIVTINIEEWYNGTIVPLLDAKSTMAYHVTDGKLVLKMLPLEAVVFSLI
ncbi:MAG: glycoside hydrolase family 13 protein [Bacillota bacterium]